MNGNYYSIQPADNNLGNHSSKEFLVKLDGVDHVMKIEDANMDFADFMSRFNISRLKGHRVKLMRNQSYM